MEISNQSKDVPHEKRAVFIEEASKIANIKSNWEYIRKHQNQLCLEFFKKNYIFYLRNLFSNDRAIEEIHSRVSVSTIEVKTDQFLTNFVSSIHLSELYHKVSNCSSSKFKIEQLEIDYGTLFHSLIIPSFFSFFSSSEKIYEFIKFLNTILDSFLSGEKSFDFIDWFPSSLFCNIIKSFFNCPLFKPFFVDPFSSISKSLPQVTFKSFFSTLLTTIFPDFVFTFFQIFLKLPDKKKAIFSVIVNCWMSQILNLSAPIQSISLTEVPDTLFSLTLSFLLSEHPQTQWGFKSKIFAFSFHSIYFLASLYNEKDILAQLKQIPVDPKILFIVSSSESQFLKLDSFLIDSFFAEQYNKAFTIAEGILYQSCIIKDPKTIALYGFYPRNLFHEDILGQLQLNFEAIENEILNFYKNCSLLEKFIHLLDSSILLSDSVALKELIPHVYKKPFFSNFDKSHQKYQQVKDEVFFSYFKDPNIIVRDFVSSLEEFYSNRSYLKEFFPLFSRILAADMMKKLNFDNFLSANPALKEKDDAFILKRQNILAEVEKKNESEKEISVLLSQLNTFVAPRNTLLKAFLNEDIFESARLIVSSIICTENLFTFYFGATPEAGQLIPLLAKLFFVDPIPNILSFSKWLSTFMNAFLSVRPEWFDPENKFNSLRHFYSITQWVTDIMDGTCQ